MGQVRNQRAIAAVTAFAATQHGRADAATLTQHQAALAGLLDFAGRQLRRPTAETTVADLLDRDLIRSWLRFAARSERRSDQGPAAAHTGAAAHQARIAALNSFSSNLGTPLHLALPLPDASDRQLPPGGRQFLELLDGQEPDGITAAVWARSAAVAALIVDTSRPLADLIALRVQDLDLDGDPPAAALPDGLYPLDAATRQILQRWLQQRASLAASSEPAAPLWLGVKPGRHRDGARAPQPGTRAPSAKSLAATHRKVTARLLGYPAGTEALRGPELEGLLPVFPPTPRPTPPSGFTDRQRTIARLLVEGHRDEFIAQELGISVRNCRTHIAKLSANLGSSNRTQLGYHIGQSGLLE